MEGVDTWGNFFLKNCVHKTPIKTKWRFTLADTVQIRSLLAHYCDLSCETVMIVLSPIRRLLACNKAFLLLRTDSFKAQYLAVLTTSNFTIHT